jgi:hypothetical protein
MVVSERKRLHPDLTFVQTIGQPGHTDGFLLDETGYLAGLDQYLNRFSCSRTLTLIFSGTEYRDKQADQDDAGDRQA